MPELNDHDLLVTLHEQVRLKFESMERSIQELKDGTFSRLVKLEAKAEENRRLIDTMINWKWYILGAALISWPVLAYLAVLLLEHTRIQ